MFDTPQEAALKAEVARLRAENSYLRRAIDRPGVRITPYSVEESLTCAPMGNTVTLHKVAGVEAALKDDCRWHVLAWNARMDGGRLEVAYFMDRKADRLDDRVFVNDVLPRMHEQFIRNLTSIITKQ